jgi:hypothetical protein
MGATACTAMSVGPVPSCGVATRLGRVAVVRSSRFTSYSPRSTLMSSVVERAFEIWSYGRVCTHTGWPASAMRAAISSPVSLVVSGSAITSAPVSSASCAMTSGPGASPRVFQLSTVMSLSVDDSNAGLPKPRVDCTITLTAQKTSSATARDAENRRALSASSAARVRATTSTSATATASPRSDTTWAITGAVARPKSCGHTAMTRPTATPTMITAARKRRNMVRRAYATSLPKGWSLPSAQ